MCFVFQHTRWIPKNNIDWHLAIFKTSIAEPSIVVQCTLEVVVDCLDYAFSWQGQDYLQEDGQLIVYFLTQLAAQQNAASNTENVLCY